MDDWSFFFDGTSVCGPFMRVK